MPSLAATRKCYIARVTGNDHSKGAAESLCIQISSGCRRILGGGQVEAELRAIPNNQGGAWGLVKLELKSQLATAALRSKNLQDEYDEYFRDTHHNSVKYPNVILVAADAPNKAAEGVRKYEARIASITRDLFGFDVVIRIAEDE
jgi:hypothetical protein